jgi:hypothetical protein
VIKAEMPALSVFVFSFICKSHMTKKSSVPNAQSANVFTIARSQMILSVASTDNKLSNAEWLFLNSQTFPESAAVYKAEHNQRQELYIDAMKYHQK